MDRVFQQIVDMLIKLKQLDAELAISRTNLQSMGRSRETGSGESCTGVLPVAVSGEERRDANEIKASGSVKEGAGMEKKLNAL